MKKYMHYIYGKHNCPGCKEAINTFNMLGIPFVYINIEDNDSGRSFIVQQGFRSVPQVFVENEDSMSLVHFSSGGADLLNKLKEREANEGS